MRSLCLILLASLAVAPLALASERAPTDGILEVRNLNATSAIFTGTRGSLWGQMDNGRLVVTDPSLGDGQIYVTGADRPPHPVNENVTIYYGKNIHFRVAGGKYRLSFKGSGIDLTAVGIGSALLYGDFNSDSAGDYRVDGGKWLSVPFVSRTVQFGSQPVTP